MRTIGHRGCPAHGPENTIAAVRRAAAHVDMVEIDVQRCGSGEIIVFHDTTLNRLTERKGAVATTPWERIRSLTVGDSDARIPLFSTLVEAVPDSIGINVEVKHAGMARELLDIVSCINNKILFSSFVPQALVPLKGSGYQLGHLFYEGWDAELDAAESLGCTSVHPSAGLVDEDRVNRAHEQGFDILAWNVPDAETVDELEAAGVDGVIVDNWHCCESA